MSQRCGSDLRPKHGVDESQSTRLRIAEYTANSSYANSHLAQNGIIDVVHMQAVIVELRTGYNNLQATSLLRICMDLQPNTMVSTA